MPLNIIDYSKAPLVRNQSPFTNLLENVLRGYQVGKAPQAMKEDLNAKQLANQLRQMDIENKPQQFALDTRSKELANAMQEKALGHLDTKQNLEDQYKRSLIEKANRITSPNDSQIKYNGDLANWVKSHPNATPEEITQFADKLTQAKLNHLNQTTERSQQLNETQFRRDATPLVKKHIALREIDNGFFPGTKDKIGQDEQSQLKNNLMLSIAKDITDPKTREKLYNATNMNITLDSIDPTYLTQYSGSGIGKKIADGLIDTYGSGSEEYQNYQREVIKASAAAKQMRQYLGDSIQPTAQEKLDKLTNPSSWNVSPKIAKENFEFMRDLFKKESQTLVRAATDPSLYFNNSSVNTNNTPSSNQLNIKNSGKNNEFDFSAYPVAGNR